MQSHPSWVRGLKLSMVVIGLSLMLSHPSWVRGLKQLMMQLSILSVSRTPRGCVDWNKIKTEALEQLDVAPLVGAWIETVRLSLMMFMPICRTPRGCVEWNCRNRSIWTWCQSRTPRGCVDWNRCFAFISFGFLCRTPRGCVDWNIIIKINDLHNNRRTPRGCVDWNMLYLFVDRWNIKSHPSWVRGLKLRIFVMNMTDMQVAPLVGAWIETCVKSIFF